MPQAKVGGKIYDMDNSEKTLLSYASIKSFYDNTSKDNFCEDIIIVSLYRVLEMESKISISSIEIYLKEHFAEIPKSYIKTMLRRLNRKKIVKYQSFNDISLSTEGKNAAIEIQDKIDSNNYEIHEYLKDIIKYLKPILKKKFKKVFSDNEVKESLMDTLPLAFIERNRANSNIYKEILNSIDKDKNIKIKFEFFSYGAIVHKTFAESSSDEIRMNNIEIYLDTNILFLFFGINEQEVKQELRKFIELCIKSTIKIYVLPNTITEFKETLKRISIIDTDITSAERNDILYNVENKLRKNNIMIDYGSIDDKKLLTDSLLREALSDLEVGVYKYYGQEHDEAILSFLKQKNLGNSKKYFLLTKHYALIKLLQKNEDLLDYQKLVYDFEKLYSIIWINSPEPVKQFSIIDLLKISLSKNDVKKVYNIPAKVRNYIEKLKLDKEDITKEDILLFISSQECEKLNSAEHLNEEHDRKIKENTKKKKMEMENTEKKVEYVKNTIIAKCKRKWDFVFKVISFIPALIASFITIYLYYNSSTLFLPLFFILVLSAFILWYVERREFKAYLEKNQNKKINTCIASETSKTFGNNS